MKKYIKLALLILWLGIIYYLSSQPGTASLNESNGLLEIIANILHVNDVNKFISKYGAFIRELAHFGEFFILGLLVYTNLSEYTNKSILLITIVLCVLYANSDEIHQYFVEDRVFSFLDILIDTLGSVLASTFSHLVDKYVAKRKST